MNLSKVFEDIVLLDSISLYFAIFMPPNFSLINAKLVKAFFLCNDWSVVLSSFLLKTDTSGFFLARLCVTLPLLVVAFEPPFSALSLNSLSLRLLEEYESRPSRRSENLDLLDDPPLLPIWAYGSSKSTNLPTLPASAI